MAPLTKALTIASFALALQGSACQTTMDRVSQAAATKAVAEARTVRPVMPAACYAHMQRPKGLPIVGQPVRWREQRWQDNADARDRKADDCRAWDKQRMALGAR